MMARARSAVRRHATGWVWVVPAATWIAETLATVGVFIAADAVMDSMEEKGVDAAALDHEDAALTPQATAYWCKAFHNWRDAARKNLSPQMFSAHFDPYWQGQKHAVCGEGGSLKKTREVLLGASILLDELKRRDAQSQHGQDEDEPTPPYIPPQDGDGTTVVIETPDTHPRPTASGLLPLLVAGSALALVLAIARRRRE